jgi:hypothetical protein
MMEVSRQLQAPAALTSGEEPRTPIRHESGWDRQQVWARWVTDISRLCQKSKPDSSVVQPVALSRYIDGAINQNSSNAF